jgi:hypothetical protein
VSARAGEAFFIAGTIPPLLAVRRLAIAFSATYPAVALRFWFWGPVLVTGTATACVTIATVLSA